MEMMADKLAGRDVFAIDETAHERFGTHRNNAASSTRQSLTGRPVCDAAADFVTDYGMVITGWDARLSWG